jgi:hypothetical protein
MHFSNSNQRSFALRKPPLLRRSVSGITDGGKFHCSYHYGVDIAQYSLSITIE